MLSDAIKSRATSTLRKSQTPNGQSFKGPNKGRQILRKVSNLLKKVSWIVLEDLESALRQLCASFFAKNIFQPLLGVPRTVIFQMLGHAASQKSSLSALTAMDSLDGLLLA
jgi:hypothetical protein